MGIQPAGPVASHTDINYNNIPNNSNPLWWLDKGLRRNIYHCIGLCGTLFFNGYDGSLFNGLQNIDTWKQFFDYPAGNKLGLMNSAALFPGVFAPYVSEIIANRYGRRWPIWIGCAINVAGAILNAAAVDLAMYIAGRVLMGIGIAMSISIAPTLMQEIAHPRFRAQIGSMYTTIYYIAAVVSASVCLGTRTITDSNIAWRIPCYLQLLGPVFTFFITVTMPESPRWLVSHGKSEEAHKVLANYHANGEMEDPLVKYELSEIILAMRDDSANETRYIDLFLPNNRPRLVILICIAIGTNWVGNGVISYYLAPILDSIGVTSTNAQASLNLGLQVWNLILSTSAALSVERVGRRPLWLISTIGMLFSFSLVMALSGSYATLGEKKNIGIAVIPFLFIFFGFYDIAWTPLSNMYSVEILPYNLRTKGQAVYCIVQNVANAVNQWVNPIILEAISWKYYAVYIGILAFFVVIIYLKFPETKNLTMEEISLIFDGDKANAIRHMAETAGRGKAVDEDLEGGPAALETVHDEYAGAVKATQI